MDKKRIATLTLDDGRSVEFPILSGTLGPDVIDIRNLAKLGVFTFDPAFFSTASCASEITFIDGDAGLLYYRGYPIEQLAEHSDFLEVCYLLLNGELPNEEQGAKFKNTVTHHTMVHDQMARFFFRVPPRCASDGGYGRCGRGPVGFLSRFPGHQKSPTP